LPSFPNTQTRRIVPQKEHAYRMRGQVT
jgi:hypothetical protein